MQRKIILNLSWFFTTYILGAPELSIFSYSGPVAFTVSYVMHFIANQKDDLPSCTPQSFSEDMRNYGLFYQNLGLETVHSY